MYTFKWILINAAITACFVLGPNMGVEWASNIALFAAWLHLTTWIISSIAIRFDDLGGRDEMFDKSINKNKVPIPVRKAWDITNAVILIIPGWMWSAAAYLVGYFFYSVSIEYMKKYIKEVESNG